MSDFNTKMRQIRFPLTAVCHAPSCIRENLLLKGKRRKREREERVGEGTGREGCPYLIVDSGSGSRGGEGRKNGKEVSLGCG